ncbi:condensation domain-containing protein [Nocardia sp. NPDC005366]|uniref:condensation domain-containing protein n=1 Tax=Nocardia sp. NPDC005366 TaxID=3156878 RepID=UPI0033BEC934
MEMTLTEDWLPEPGVLVEFTPTATTRRAVIDATVSPAPPTFLQESHIRRWAERRGTDNPLASEISLCFTVAMPLDREALCRAFTTFLRRHETLRSWFDASEDALVSARYLIDAADLDLETVDKGHFTDGEHLRDILVAEFRAAADPTRWPAVVCAAIDHGADGFTLLYSTDHAFSDGLSLVSAVFELHSCYTAYARGEQPALLPVGSYVEFATAERSAAEAGSAELDAMAALLADNAHRVRPLPWELGLRSGELAESRGYDVDLLDCAECDAFSDLCKSLGHTFSSGLFAVIALAELELAGRTDYLALNVVGTRDEPKYRLAQGWFVNLLPISFEVGRAGLFTDLIARAATAADTVKPLAAVPIHAALGRATDLTGVPMPATTDFPWVSYLDLRAMSGTALENALPRVSGIHGLGSRSRIGQVSPLWFSRELDRLHVTVLFPDTDAALASATRYLHHLRDILRSVARTGEYRTATADAPALPG